MQAAGKKTKGILCYAVGLQLWLSWPLQMKKGESDQYTGISLRFFFPIFSNDLQNTSAAVPGMLNS